MPRENELYPVKRMIRGLGEETSSTHSQTFNGYEVRPGSWVRPRHSNQGAQWAIFGKQNWRCGMNQTPG